MTSIRKYYRAQYKWYFITILTVILLSFIFYYYILQDFITFYNYLSNEFNSIPEKKAGDKADNSVLAFFFLSIFSIGISLTIARVFSQKPLYCPNHNCYKTVLPKDIIPFKCPFCDSENNKFSSLYTHCENFSCKSIIPAIPCPHCGNQIDLLGEYDIKKIKEKRYGKKTKV